MSLLSISLVLFLIMDPIGNISPYIAMTRKLSPNRHKIVIIREMLIALIVMIIFNYLGETIFNVLEISETAVKLSSGVILFLFAVRILFPTLRSPRANLPEEEPFIIPLAIPLIAGPSLLATIMLFAHMESSQEIMLAAIFIAWLAAVVVLFFAPQLQRLLSDNGLMALERLMGMVLVLLAIQRFMEGVQQFIATYV